MVEVPVLPVVIPLGLAIFGLLLWRLHAERRFSFARVAVAAALSVYAAGITANTIFPIFLNTSESGEPWTPWLALIPFADYEFHDAMLNIAVFLPLGILIPLVLTRPSWWKVLSVVAGTSLTIELLQLAVQGLFAGGHIADINDFISNVVGGALGYGVFVLLTFTPWSAPVIDRFRWSTPSQSPAVRNEQSTPL